MRSYPTIQKKIKIEAAFSPALPAYLTGLFLLILILLLGVRPAAAAAPQPVVGEAGIVVAVEKYACDVGHDILSRGGTAADAAVAVGFALAVTYPSAGNLGGGGFLLHRASGGATEALDFRETAPARASRDMFLNFDGTVNEGMSLWSPLAAGVPGTVAGLGTLHERHGTFSWNELLAPAIALARDGFVIDRLTSERFQLYAGRLGPDPESRRIFLKDSTFYQPGDTLRQPELAATLQRIAAEGPREFYTGETARRLADYMMRSGGLMTKEDLRSYRSIVRRPLEGQYKGYTILAMPPPSSGGVAILEILNILEEFPLSDWGWGSVRGLNILVEAMRRAFADRAAYLGDPGFVDVPVDGLIDPAYGDSLRRLIQEGLTNRPGSVSPGKPRGLALFMDSVGGSLGIIPNEGGETTHFSVVDAEGNAVAMTTTINASFGSGITVEGLGFLLNNEMDDFAVQPGVPNYYGLIQGEANAIRPLKRPLSSMTPLMVLRPVAARQQDAAGFNISGTTAPGSAAEPEMELYLLLGSPGGPRIITSVLQVLLNVVTYGMEIHEAVGAPRLHHQWMPDTLWFEPVGWATDLMEGARAKGQTVATWDEVIGSTHSIMVAPSGRLLGAPDPRRSGHARGVDRVIRREDN
ncbi:MAG: gamma-glutamyltransferase [Candidatus Eisenbacteria bacterium]|uniref:Glutathione hydrolase proenzyme n=1 Tax=Eiseniibacteriota bacterium TaxID=2212470 RepID=A0A948RUE0_UNCEI|nr:gamma-glutamyltransferase [Candidatus Eisenbacteria bacterium]MBU1948165.1 gamma-glutamyltransferase [Candidatus Eisenbacteria bacterium]MBU2690166.1 gamma-glutamyltransferase [Candidatus Eisenbacteria bacterium]